ncbi:MAG TPA: hypothetical protein VMD92_09835 [Acidobacteriaceae bacterium]|nr:hypothetical protein [Acidobacteriaceae bacterium]
MLTMQFCSIASLAVFRNLKTSRIIRRQRVVLLVVTLLAHCSGVLADPIGSDTNDSSSVPVATNGSVMLSRPGVRVQPESNELVFSGMSSFGNYRVFGAAERAKLWTSGIEYEHPLGWRLLGARFDYSAETLPLVLLSQPAKADRWGNPLSSQQVLVPGMGIFPLGFRLLWRDGRRVMPYFESQGGVFGFTQKALSPVATYENWSFHSTGGMKVRLSSRYDLRLGMLSDLHFSNAFVVASNPGVDLMNASVGIVYRLPASRTLR